jgi:alpha-galactosidase
MKNKVLLFACTLLILISCKDEKDIFSVTLSNSELNVEFHNINLNSAKPGVNLLIGNDEVPLEWFPLEASSVNKTERSTPKGDAIDLSLMFKHPQGYELIWSVSELSEYQGFTVRAAFKNNSSDTIRLKDFVLMRTGQTGLVCNGDPASWWLLPAMNYSRQGGNLAQEFPSRKRLQEQKVYGFNNIGNDDPRNHDGHWRFLDEVITLYSSADRKGIAIGAVGPGVSYVHFNFRVDKENILAEIVSKMDDILIEPGEIRESEEVLFLAQPYKEALTNIFSWIAETHNARKYRNPIYGWCSWYDRYFDIDETHILKIADAVKELRGNIPIEVIQLDDGWQGSPGNWSANSKFPRGMKHIADKITEAGAIPGIWMSPVVCSIEKPAEWFQNKNGRYLDPTHPEVEEFIISAVKEIKDDGYRYFKFDYNSIGSFRPYNPKMTRFEIMHHLFSLYREAIGEESFLLACGATMRPVVGLADASRIGWDALARWKSYPLADDSLPTLPTDIFTGITLTGISSVINGKLFINDPDVTYLLPRAESHIWQGPQGSFNPEKHGLKWPGLQSFHSYFGLIGGMTMMSEPLYKPEYQQQIALRMAEILKFPAPDKGWSMNGDIDPWGRQFGFVAERPWGNFATVILWNKEDTISDLRLDTYSLKALKEKFHIWSFWDEKYLGIDKSFTARNIPPHGCVLIRLTPISGNKDIPVIIGSNLHISIGSAELKSVESKPGKMKIELTGAGALEGKIYIFSHTPLNVDKAEGCEAFIFEEIENLYVVVITNRALEGGSIVHLTKSQSVTSFEEILQIPELYHKLKKAGPDLAIMK